MKFSVTKMIKDTDFSKYARKRTLKSYTILETETGPTNVCEVVLSKRRVCDAMPVHIGNTILQYSKLHFLK